MRTTRPRAFNLNSPGTQKYVPAGAIKSSRGVRTSARPETTKPKEVCVLSVTSLVPSAISNRVGFIVRPASRQSPDLGLRITIIKISLPSWVDLADPVSPTYQPADRVEDAADGTEGPLDHRAAIGRVDHPVIMRQGFEDVLVPAGPPQAGAPLCANVQFVH